MILLFDLYIDCPWFKEISMKEHPLQMQGQILFTKRETTPQVQSQLLNERMWRNVVVGNEISIVCLGLS